MLIYRLEEVRLDHEPQEFVSAHVHIPENEEPGGWRVTFETREDPMLEPSEDRFALVLRAEGDVLLMGSGHVANVRFVDGGAYVEIVGEGGLNGVMDLGDF
ncbi:MAG TPA: hypothetical protein VJ787_03705 [Thermoleophilia bacterium]|nr:hypothetical protein [Thermoleophilia bacterium]